MALSKGATYILAAAFIVAGLDYSVAQDRTNPKKVAQAAADAIAAGDARELAKLGGGQIEIDLGQGSSVYSRDQARYVFASFFDDHPPSDFTLLEVKVMQELCIARGTFQSVDAGQPWSAFMRLSASDGRWSLKEIQLFGGLQTGNRLPPSMIFDLSPR